MRLCVVLALLAACGCARRPGACGGGAQLGAPWPGIRGCGDAQGRSGARGPSSGALAWALDTGDGVSAALVAADGTIYVEAGSSGLAAVTPAGEVKWTVADGGFPFALDADGNVLSVTTPRIVATRPDGRRAWTIEGDAPFEGWGPPALGSDGTLYVGGDRLHAFAAGSERWTEYLPQSLDGWCASFALGLRDTLYLAYTGVASYRPDYRYIDRLVAIDSGDHLRSVSESADGCAGVSVGDDGTVYWASGGWVSGLNPLGHLQFEQLLGEVVLAPAIGPDGTLYVSELWGPLHALAPDGTELWRAPLPPGAKTFPVVDANGTIYVGAGPRQWIDALAPGDEIIYALAPDGTILWSHDLGRGRAGRLALGEGALYVPFTRFDALSTSFSLIALAP